MPGFIARKLCPQLVFVKPDFKKYTHYCHLTREGAQNFPGTGPQTKTIIQSTPPPPSCPHPVLYEYDPHLIATSLDEAYLDITAVCGERSITWGEVRNVGCSVCLFA